MTIVEAFKKVYIEDIFTIQGRASRKEFWGSELVFLPSYFVLLLFGYYFSDGLGDLIGNIGYLWSLIALFTASIRRAHDVGKSGWFMIIPLYNFVLQITPSQQSSNNWGAPRPHTLINNGVENDN